MNAQTELIRKLSESGFNEIARETESVVVINTSFDGIMQIYSKKYVKYERTGPATFKLASNASISKEKG